MSLKLRNITKRFENKILYDNFCFDFPEKGIVAITGESGIGKTTLLRIIAGLDKKYDGEVLGGGIGTVSFAFQEYRLFPEITALQNVIISISGGKDKAVFEKAKELLLRFGFNNEDLELLPHELSGGMKQRVSLARAFIKQCPILILDEPTKELDAANVEIVRQIILEESENRLVIIVSHNNTELEQLNAQQLTISKIQ